MDNTRYLQSVLCQKPPANILERNIESVHLFVEAFRSLHDPENEVHKNNSFAHLNSEAFKFQ